MHEQILDLLRLTMSSTRRCSPRSGVTPCSGGWWGTLCKSSSAPDTQLEKLKCLVERSARHLKIFFLVVDHYISLTRGEFVWRFLVGAEQSTVKHLYIHLRSSSARDRITFSFHYLNPLLQSLTLREINFSARLFYWVSPPPALRPPHDYPPQLRPHHRRIARWHGLLLSARSPRPQGALLHRLRDWSVKISRLVLLQRNRLRSYHYGGSPSSFYIPPGAGRLTGLYICSALPILSNITALTICGNSLKILSSLRGAEVANFQSLRVLQFLMFELKAVDLDNIYEFLRTYPPQSDGALCLPTTSDHGPFEYDLIDEQRQNPLEDGLANLEDKRIENHMRCFILTLCWLNLNVPMFAVVHPMSCLAKIHLNDVRITDEALRRMVILSPSLRVLTLFYCNGPLAMIIASSRKLSSLIIVECNNVRGVVVMPDSPLHNFHCMGSPLSPFNLSGGARLLTDLLFCFNPPILGHQVLREWFRNNLPFLSNITSLSICSNTLQVVSFLRHPGANLDMAILDNFQSLTMLELTMLEFKAVGLDNIFVFLKSCHRPNLKKFLVTDRTIHDSDIRFEEDFPGSL
uniref:At1g61320/AtMIF1 LRR domain-containing protein n=1 Tax=Oryza nivara TaxID=4536 RepID=A0A0E0FJB0_ORYNI